MLERENERRRIMKKIEAIIRPDVFSDVRKALALEGIDGLSVTEIAGCGRQEGRTGLFRGNVYEMEFSAKLKLEMIVEDHLVEPIIEAILEYAATGEVGDGKIFIFPVDEAIRIRTKERGAIAVY
jgi:nitrogen regulatory protein P-II 1